LKIATIQVDTQEVASIAADFGYIPIPFINHRTDKDWPHDLFTLLKEGLLEDVRAWYNGDDIFSFEKSGRFITRERVQYAPLYRHPGKIWGIGLNYKAHADDLSEKLPDSEPASFMKPDTTIIGCNDAIEIPELSGRTTGEAELGLIIGKKCKNVSRENWHSVIAGFTTIIDMTAEDILKRNPRNLTQSKSFDTFFSFGPIFYTLDEVKDVFKLNVQTVINDKVHAENLVNNMTFPLDFLVSYHSKIMTLLPGDIISTGTPGAAPLQDGDIIECRIDDCEPLVNPVVDLKIEKEDIH
jgi:2-keto-4-pentenoate hydratase/2-oxohepta-3-ene-1,7-dioic acid hydratase in catechol pathway